jgi:hypothetical protein
VKKINTALAALGIAAVTALAAPAAAQAAPQAPATGPATSADSPNGYFYAWEAAYKGGRMCAWQHNAGNWSTCNVMDMRNKASSLQNRGYPGAFEDVNVYYHPWQTGAHNCLPNGAYWDNLIGLHFLWDGQDGQGQVMNDNIASHRWSNDC